MDTETGRSGHEETVKVSVIMGVYNQMDRVALHAAVNSILNQTLTDFEFIIYDDGSVPEVGEYIRELEALDPRIHVFGREKNHGLAFSLNACAELASGTYIARMDADDISARNRLEVQVRFMDEHPEIDWCGTNAFLFDENGVWGSRRMPKHPMAEDYLRYSPYIHPSVMYRSRILQRYHYSTDRTMLFCEDYEIFMRLYRKGYCGCNIQDNLLYYRENMDSYGRRTLSHRVNETKVRYHNYKSMGILFPRGWLFVLRPLLGAVVPNRMIAIFKRKESERIHAAGKD